PSQGSHGARKELRRASRTGAIFSRRGYRRPIAYSRRRALRTWAGESSGIGRTRDFLAPVRCPTAFVPESSERDLERRAQEPRVASDVDFEIVGVARSGCRVLADRVVAERLARRHS